MPRIVTASEAQNHFGAMVQWAEENQDNVVVERRGKPAAVIISYEEYQKLEQLREQERRRKAFEALEAIRARVAERNPDLTTEDAYRLAGFSEEVIQKTLDYDRKLAQEAP
jgi:prevent-host-death family protein